MSSSLLDDHAEDLRSRVAALAAGLDAASPPSELRAAAHKLRGSALVLGLDGLAVASAAYEAALTDQPDLAGARRAVALAGLELDRALEPDSLRPLRHDLRNDLGVILMASKLLEVELADPGQTELARSIATAAERMTARLVELKEPEPIEPPRVQQTTGAAALSVLLVDDDDLVTDVVRRMLSISGARVDVVGGIADARAALAAHHYESVVVDLHLADGHGAELIPELRSRGIRVVVLSGDHDQSVEGAHVTLAKPVDSAILIAAVSGAHPA